MPEFFLNFKETDQIKHDGAKLARVRRMSLAEIEFSIDSLMAALEGFGSDDLSSPRRHKLLEDIYLLTYARASIKSFLSNQPGRLDSVSCEFGNGEHVYCVNLLNQRLTELTDLEDEPDVDAIRDGLLDELAECSWPSGVKWPQAVSPHAFHIRSTFSEKACRLAALKVGRPCSCGKNWHDFEDLEYTPLDASNPFARKKNELFSEAWHRETERLAQDYEEFCRRKDQGARAGRSVAAEEGPSVGSLNGPLPPPTRARSTPHSSAKS